MGRITNYTTASTASGRYLVVDDTTNGTMKLSTNKLLTVVVSATSVSSLPKTISDSNISSKHVVINAVLSNPSAQTGDWTATTSAGSVAISGTIDGTTDITLYLAETV